MNWFSWLFLSLLLITALVEIGLARRQLTTLMRHRDRVPDAFRSRVSLQSHQRAADYGMARLRLEFMEIAVSTLLIATWTVGGGVAGLDTLWRQLEWGALVTGIAVIISALLLMSMLELPLVAYRTFVIEERYGFNKTTPGLFMRDTFKQGALIAALGIPLTAIILFLLDNAGSIWWLYAWAVWMGFTGLIMWGYPSFVAPLFNTFKTLENVALNQRIVALLERCGFTSKGIYVMDGSKRSGHGNAYFAGLGTNKRIVFFDTLLSCLTADEIIAVLAHELGHYKRKHVHKRLLSMALISLAGFGLLGLLIDQAWFYSGLGVQTPSSHTALLLFMLASPVFMSLFRPWSSYWMRRHEFEADDFASQHTDPHHLITALVKLYQENAATLTPDPWYSAYHDSHPPAPVRISHLAGKLG